MHETESMSLVEGAANGLKILSKQNPGKISSEYGSLKHIGDQKTA